MKHRKKTSTNTKIYEFQICENELPTCPGCAAFTTCEQEWTEGTKQWTLEKYRICSFNVDDDDDNNNRRAESFVSW